MNVLGEAAIFLAAAVVTVVIITNAGNSRGARHWKAATFNGCNKFVAKFNRWFIGLKRHQTAASSRRGSNDSNNNKCHRGRGRRFNDRLIDDMDDECMTSARAHANAHGRIRNHKTTT